MSRTKRRKLPEGWNWERLKDICTVNPTRAKAFKRAENVQTSFVPMDAIDEAKGIIAKRLSREYAIIAKGYTHFEEGDVLFAKITPCMQNGKSAVANGLIDGIGFGSTEFHVLRPKTKVTKEWVFYFIRTAEFRNKAKANFDGSAGQQRVPKSFLENTLIPLPVKIDEQSRITNNLSLKIGAIEKMRQAALRQKEAAEAMQGAILRKVFYFQEGGKLPQGWIWAKTIDVLDHSLKSPIRMGPFGSQLTKDELVSDGVFVLGIEHVLHKKFDDTGNKFINDEKFKQLRGFEVKPGDVLMTMMGTIGRTAVVPEGVRSAIISSHLLKMTLRRDVYPDYIAWVLSNLSPVYRQVHAESQGAIMQGLNTGIIKKLSFPLPSKFDEQLAIVRTLEQQMADVEKMRQATSRQLEAIEAMPAAMLREVFDFDAGTGAAI